MKRSTTMRAAWGLAVVTVAVGYAAVVVPEQRAIRAVEARVRDFYDIANRNERRLAREPVIRVRLAEVRAEVAALSASSSTSETLQFLDRDSRRHGVRIVAVGPSAPAPASAPVRKAPFPSGDFDIALEGSYRSIMGFVGDLSHADVLLGVRSLTLTQGDAQALRSPELRAELQARIYRLTPQTSERMTDASTAPR